MPITTSKKKISVNSKNELKLFLELLTFLHTPRRYEEIAPVMDQFGLEKNLSTNGLTRLKRRVLNEGLNKLALQWKGSLKIKLYSSLPNTDANPLEMAVAFNPRSYLCYQTALFWNELTEQVPHTFYIANERPGTSPRPSVPVSFDEFELRDAFVKLPKGHPNVATFGEYRFVFLARAHTGNAGVETRLIPFNQNKIRARITGLERTLLDCISAPENAGGVANVVDAMKRSTDRVKIDKLLELYIQLDFKYPHWQRIGLLLERIVSPVHAKKWRSHFGAPQTKFYLAKGYKLGWELDTLWNVYYPKGLFR